MFSACMHKLTSEVDEFKTGISNDTSQNLLNNTGIEWNIMESVEH